MEICTSFELLSLLAQGLNFHPVVWVDVFLGGFLSWPILVHLLLSVSERRQPDSTCCVEPLPVVLLRSTALLVFTYNCCMTWIRLDRCNIAAAPKAACHSLSKAFLKLMKALQMFCWCRCFFTQDVRIESMFRCASPCTKASLFFSDEYFQYYLAGVADDPISFALL